MDVPFHSSGAISRAHYTLVRNVESTTSSSVADHLLLAEVDSARGKLANPRLSSKACMEALISLMYCSISCDTLPPGSLDFALLHAVNLAESGATSREKYIGYLFCSHIMPKDHELRLMLVNTLRKDLESSIIPRVCLALDMLISSASEFVIPAVQTRLHELLSHSNPLIRRRAILAYKSISPFEHDLYRTLTTDMIKCLTGKDYSVTLSAISTCLDIVDKCPEKGGEIHAAMNRLFKLCWPPSKGSKRSLLASVLRALAKVGISLENVPLLLNIIQHSTEKSGHPLLLDAFRCLSTVDISELLQMEQSESSLRPSQTVAQIRHLLGSADISDQYVFISCLNYINPALWAGKLPDTASVLDSWEVERIMQLLDLDDEAIRKKTLGLLAQIDSNIVDGYFQKVIDGMSYEVMLANNDLYMARLIEVAEIQGSEDGELFARYIRRMLSPIDVNVMEGVVERVLAFQQDGDDNFCTGCAITLIAPITESDHDCGPTLVVIAAALATQYVTRLSIAPRTLIVGFADRLSDLPFSVQDACLLAMTRILAECDDLPLAIIEQIKSLREKSKRHIRRRCDQFLKYSENKDDLRKIISRSRSPLLPDFLDSLTRYEMDPAGFNSLVETPLLAPSAGMSVMSPPPNVSPQPSGSPSELRSASPTASLAASKLRYAPYDAPKPLPRHSIRRAASPNSSRSSHDEAQSIDDIMAQTITPGELTLAAGGDVLEMSLFRTPTTDNDARKASPLVDNLKKEKETSTRENLIALDSPFQQEPPATGLSLLTLSEDNIPEPDFEKIWNSLTGYNARGWCDMSTDSVVQQLQQLQLSLSFDILPIDQTPFRGDLKILIQSSPTSSATVSGQHPLAALRLRSDANADGGDEGGEAAGCLWRMRCQDSQLGLVVKKVLGGD